MHDARVPFDAVPPLRPGAHVRVIAPASPFDRADFERGVERLSARYRVSYADDIFAKHGYLAGDDARRLRELTSALEEPSVDAIVAARGGYGVTRLLDGVPIELVRRAKKLLVGFSDLTALHALWARAGLRSIHGAMAGGLGRAEPALVERWISIVEGAAHPEIRGLTTIAIGRAEGPLIGGNLALLAALAGTRHAPPVDGAILFLEDLGEAPYRIDRMLTTLGHAGWLDRVAGIALGRFTACDASGDGLSAEDVFADRLGRCGVPIVSGVAAGHVDDNLELPLGARARVDGGSGTLAFLETAVV